MLHTWRISREGGWFVKNGNVFTSALIVGTIILNSKDGCSLCTYVCYYAYKLSLVENKMSGADYTYNVKGKWKPSSFKL